MPAGWQRLAGAAVLKDASWCMFAEGFGLRSVARRRGSLASFVLSGGKQM